jgi:hypothetical protein
MSNPAEMAERHAAILARLAEAGERLALKNAQRALDADDPDVEAKATAAFHRATRSVRQCLALEAKLVRDAARAEREDRADAQLQSAVRTERRKAVVRSAVERLIWTEAEDPAEAERLEDELDDLLDDEQLSETFTAEAVETQVLRLCRALGVPPPEGGPADPRLIPATEAAPPDWRSSA